MGHITGKDVYGDLEKKIDGLWMRTPRKKSFYKVLKLLYTDAEADLVVRMPFGFAPLDRITRLAGRPQNETRKLLEGLADKGLVLDIAPGDRTFYAPSPIVIGLFEFTMMRTDGGVDQKKAAELFHHCMLEDGALFAANFKPDARIASVWCFKSALPLIMGCRLGIDMMSSQ